MLLELRSTGQQTVFPGSVHESGEPIDWTDEHSLAAVDPKEIVEKVRHLAAASLILKRWSGARDDLATALIGALLRSGWSSADANAFIHAIADEAGDEELRQRLKGEALSRSLESRTGHVPGWPRVAELLGKADADRLRSWLTPESASSSDDEVVQRLNLLHAVVMIGGQCRILNEITDPVFGRRDITLSSPEDLRTKYANVLVSLGKKQVPAIDAWLRAPGRREYQGIVFAPNEEVPGYHNLWRGFAVEPREGECSRYLAHLRENIASGNEAVYNYILDWMADAVQNPTRRPGVAIVLRGKQGTGKGVMCSEFGRLFGQHFIHVQSSRHITGNFNAHLKDALVVFADEAFWAGDKTAEGVLKGMVTEDTIAVEFKGRDVIFVRNYIRLLIASNHDWVVPTGAEERRFFVLDVGEERMQDARYFKAIVEQMANGGRGALLYLLVHRDLSRADIRKFPQTPALWENKIHSMSSVQRFWLARLMAGTIKDEDEDWTGSIVVGELHDAYQKELSGGRRSYISSSTQFGMALRKLVPGLKRERRDFGGRRVWFYVFPPLSDCRKAFERAMRFDIPWDSGSAVTRFQRTDI
jgi:hypothetical protein